MKFSVIAFLILFVCNVFGQDCPIIPTPTTYVIEMDRYYLDDYTTISEANLDEETKKWLLKYWTEELQLNMAFVQDGADIRFQKGIHIQQNSYSIKIGEQILITYTSDASRFHALQSLKQMMIEEDGFWSLPKVWSMMHLDLIGAECTWM